MCLRALQVFKWCGGRSLHAAGHLICDACGAQVFNSPEDKIIYDVGHQAYVHKILTNRRSRMSTIRQTGGLSGVRTPLNTRLTLSLNCNKLLCMRLAPAVQPQHRLSGIPQASQTGARVSMTPLVRATAPLLYPLRWAWQSAVTSRCGHTRIALA